MGYQSERMDCTSGLANLEGLMMSSYDDGLEELSRAGRMQAANVRMNWIIGQPHGAGLWL